ncbi:MAG: tetratricopeptide repeat protein [Acidobacteriota bacterium]
MTHAAALNSQAVPALPVATLVLRRRAVGGVLAGLFLAALGGMHFTTEITRQSILSPLVVPGGWQRAMVADGVSEVASRAEAAARRIGDAAAYRDGAAVLGALAGATGDPELIQNLQQRSLALASLSLSRSPGSARAHLMAGAAMIDLDGDTKTGAWHLARAAALDPNNASLRRRLGAVALAQDWDNEARSHFRAALTVDATLAGDVYEILDLFDTSLDAAAVTPRTVAARIALGRWLQTEHDDPGALAAFRQALILADSRPEPSSSGVRRWSYQQLIGHLFRQHDWPAAITLTTQRLQARRFAGNEEQALLLYHRGRAQRQAGDHQSALLDLTRAVQLDGEALPYADALATTLAGLGRHNEAARIWAQALARPRWTSREKRWVIPMRLGRARSLIAAHETTPAVEELRLVLQMDPSQKTARRLAKDLGL